jgi:hypothetical protein
VGCRGCPKRKFRQPHASITLPKAPKSLFNAVFGPLVGQKLHNFKDICAFGRVITVRGCPKISFWTASIYPELLRRY